MVDRVAPRVSIALGVDPEKKLHEEVEALHRRCGVYTKPAVVRRILDAVGWQYNADLSQFQLLEPAAGNGAFVVEAARRLVVAFIRHRIDLKAHMLVGRIVAFELHQREARRARSQVVKALRTLGVHHLTANACARSWIRNADFLVSKPPAEGYTHVVGNPPYVRWSKIPIQLKARYRRRVPEEMMGGDLFVPFLDQALESLRTDGRCGFLCSDRWRFNAYAEPFRKKWLPRIEITSEDAVPSNEVFVENVGSYPTILIGIKKADRSNVPLRIETRGKTLVELGCVVKVGPALGHTPAYVLEPGDDGVETKLLRPWIDGSEITEGAITSRGRRVIAMHGKDGKLIVPNQFPRLKARLTRFRTKLEQRAIVEGGARWFQPIDRVRAVDWKRPKLLIPELAKIPRVAIDRSGAIPSHGVYAIFARDDDIESVYERLRDGKLAAALEGIAPKVKGGYVRCYRRFLLMIRV